MTAAIAGKTNSYATSEARAQLVSAPCSLPNYPKSMITINREKGYICLSRCDYLYRDGLEKRDEKANVEMGDGDILIPLPPYMISKEWDNQGGTNHPERVTGSDGQGAEIIIAEIIKRLGENA